MIFYEDNYRFMYAALQEAEKAFDEDEVPVGAVVIHENKIIGRGYNQNRKLNDPTAHAEIIAITSASNSMNKKILEDCDIYVTLEPCLMCTGALILARIRSVFFSAFDPKSGACGSVYNIPEENKLNHKPNIFSGIYRDESESLLKNYFAVKRHIT